MDNKKIFLISGKARCGKGTVSKILKEKLESKGYKVCEIQIMRTLKGYLKDYFDWDGLEETKPRELLQQMGTEIIRQQLDMPNFHIDRLTEDIKVLSNYFDYFIVNDIRLVAEIEELRKRFPLCISINVVKENYISPLTLNEERHITEHDLDNYKSFDYELLNSSLENLEFDVTKIIDSEVK